MRNIDSFDYMRAVVLGAVIGMSSLTLIYMIGVALDVKEPETKIEQTEPNHGTYTIVSKYKGCDVVQWSYSPLAEYKYFLHCPK